MAIGNTHKTHGEDRMCSSKNVIAEKQTHKHTHTQTHTRSSQYSASLSGVE